MSRQLAPGGRWWLPRGFPNGRSSPLLEPTRSCVTRRVFQQRSSPLEEETDQLPASMVESSARYYHGLIRIGRKGRVFPRVIRIFAAEQCERSKNDRIFIYEAAEYEM